MAEPPIRKPNKYQMNLCRNSHEFRGGFNDEHCHQITKSLGVPDTAVLRILHPVCHHCKLLEALITDADASQLTAETRQLLRGSYSTTHCQANFYF